MVFHLLSQKIVLRQSFKAVAYPKSMDEKASRYWALA